MAHQPPNLLAWIGLAQWGDLNGLTLYRSRRRRLTVFPRTRPSCAPSDAQLDQRAAFAAAIAAWRALPAATRALWDLITRRLSLPITGYNLYLSNQLRPDPSALATLQRQARVTLG